MAGITAWFVGSLWVSTAEFEGASMNSYAKLSNGNILEKQGTVLEKEQMNILMIGKEVKRRAPYIDIHNYSTTVNVF